MKRLFQVFQEIVLVDTTHDINANKYKYIPTINISFIVSTQGQYVLHALVNAETKDNLRAAIQVFKSSNPNRKNSRAVLGELFPKPRQLLCFFHAVAWLERQAARLSSGTTEHKDKVKKALSALAFSKSKMEEEWALFERGNVPHLGNHTDNRLESKWGKIKQVVSKDESIGNLISTHILMQEVAEDENLRAYHRVGSRSKQDKNSELAALTLSLSPFAFDLVSAEFMYATGGRADYAVTTDGGLAILESRRSGDQHSMNLKARLKF
ncbi:Hypothetical protein PHPALM_15936 [Phytophthora palmivora]|uniref:ZSWIM1/3 RNaseH-like domain-containing protein n=1 Tax=Phytophthora palmivora TaxID=4796 RepID=A0A2P4XQZ7_9STRA|nr:Hypothetical protein PHPALM_15936 [Phytophthora palmivora]